MALGKRVRELRRSLGESQARLGERLGLTYQQVQKYESGANRISATMLVKLSEALGVSSTSLLQSASLLGDASAQVPEADLLTEAFGRIRSPETRAAVLRIVTGLADRDN